MTEERMPHDQQRTTTRRRNPRGAGERLRNEIIDAAIRLLDATEDPTALTLRGIARATGVQAPSIYAHFAGVQDIIDALRDASFSELETQVRDAIDAASDAARGLRAASHAYVHFGWDHPARYRLMFTASGYAEHAVNTYALVEDTITAYVTDADAAARDPHQDTFLLWVALHGIATLEKPDRDELRRLGPLDREAAIDELVDRIVIMAG